MTPDAAIAQLASTAHLLIALDFDGTLSPLVDEPLRARMLPAARAAVDALVATPATTVALVSGRTLRDLRVIAEHGDDSTVLLAGSHGAEGWPAGADDVTDPRDATARADLESRAARLAEDVEGAWIEPKKFGFALHTRLAVPSRATALQQAIDQLVAARAPHWRRRLGHDILEFSDRHDGKDGAVARLRELTGATAVLFAGDDVTDEDAMRALEPQDVGVRVGPGPTAATVRVEGIPQLADMLVGLAHERARMQE